MGSLKGVGGGGGGVRGGGEQVSEGQVWETGKLRVYPPQVSVPVNSHLQCKMREKVLVGQGMYDRNYEWRISPAV